MIVRDMFTTEFIDQYCDIDVYDDVEEGIGIAYCGAKLTEKAIEEYEDVLDDYVIISGNERFGYNAILNISECDNWEYHLKKLKKLFYGCAGYCDYEEYDEYFIEE